ncbi:MAG: DegT/DnrJ/EryC1/StrS family aminotransferase [Spirochaetia bacterium]|jgi:dTDP-4-amino-4,6-dideoxygalactose transaminase|nr:DegT/DnrJ/EryC1/StrS family aminotransferase [Spirochaetia bacterium]
MNQNTDFIPFARPSIGTEEEEAVIKVLRSGWLTTGVEAKNFETEFGAYIGSSNALAVNSATSGLHLALEAFGVGPGDKVITTPYTFTSTAEVIRYLGADPVFADIDPDNFNISSVEIEILLKKDPSIKGIIPVHIAGNPCNMEDLLRLREKYNVFIIEDAAHAFPVKYNGKLLGTIGDAGVFSFYATKTITTGEGGMIVTNNSKAAKRMSVMRLHGIDREIWDRYTSDKPSWQYSIVDAGYKYNMPDIAAAIGREQLKKASLFLKKRKNIAEFYFKNLVSMDFLKLPEQIENHGWHLFMARIIPEKLTVSRDKFIQEIINKGIGISVHFIPLHIMPYYKNKYGYNEQDYPQTLEVYNTVFSLPIYPNLTENQLKRIVSAIKEAGAKYRRIP